MTDDEKPVEDDEGVETTRTFIRYERDVTDIWGALHFIVEHLDEFSHPNFSCEVLDEEEEDAAKMEWEVAIWGMKG